MVRGKNKNYVHALLFLHVFQFLEKEGRLSREPEKKNLALTLYRQYSTNIYKKYGAKLVWVSLVNLSLGYYTSMFLHDFSLHCSFGLTSN